MTALEDRVLF